MLYRNRGEETRVPSSRALAARFGLARSTVQLELEELTRRGILRTRNGSGTFIVPRPSGISSSSSDCRIIGVIVDNHGVFCYSQYAWQLQGAIGNQLVLSQHMVRLLTLFGNTSEAILDEIRGSYIDGLVWIRPPDDEGLLRRIAGVMPLVVVEKAIEGINSVYIDYEAEFVALARRFAADGRRRVMVAADNPDDPEMVRSAWRRAGLELDERLLFPNTLDTEAHIRKALDGGARPDGLLLLNTRRRAILDVLRGAGVDWMRECRVACDIAAAGFPDFAGWCHEPDFDGIGKAANAMLERLAAGDQRVEHRVFGSVHHAVRLDGGSCVRRLEPVGMRGTEANP